MIFVRAPHLLVSDQTKHQQMLAMSEYQSQADQECRHRLDQNHDPKQLYQFFIDFKHSLWTIDYGAWNIRSKFTSTENNL